MAKAISKKARKTAASGEAVKEPMAAGKATSNTVPTVNVTFALLDLGAKQVSLSGDFNRWSTTATPMKWHSRGHWEITLALAPGRYEYKFYVDGEWMPDPHAQEQISNQFGTLNSVIKVLP